MFNALGRIIADHPWRIVALWGVAALVGTLWAFNTPEPPPDEMGSFLPSSSPFSIATEKLGEAFPAAASRSMVAIVALRAEGITDADIAWLDDITLRAQGVKTGHILMSRLSPAVLLYRPRLVSTDGQSAMAVLNLTTNMISAATGAYVGEIEAEIARRRPPAGLTVELTGSAAIGRDYARATKEALDRTTWVTVVAVLAILILVYRSPIGALVPLLSIGLSAYLTLIVLAACAKWLAWGVSTMERIFAIVLIFGAGVDYALFWIARYRERLQSGAAIERSAPHASPDFRDAAQDSTRHAGEAVLFSAITTMVGMCSLLAAQLGPSHNAGKVLVVALAMALLAGLTLVPAVARLLGRALFWPVGASAPPTFAQRVVWPRLADGVVRAPAGVLALGLILLAIPAAMALNMQPRFDSLMQLPEGSTSQRGYDITEAHFSRGQIYGSKLLFVFDRLPGSVQRMREASENLRERILKLRGVADVYSLDAPIGKSVRVPQTGLAGRFLSAVSDKITEEAQTTYLAARPVPAMVLEVLIDDPPFSIEAMNIIDQIRAIGQEWADRRMDAGIETEVHLSGLTPYIMAVRDVAGRDQRVVMSLAVLLIAVIVLWLVRDVPLTLFMVFTTLLTFGATLKLTEIFFIHVMGFEGIDWKVRLIVFVIVVAVGQDYNIFLVTRLMEERRHFNSRDAVRRAVISTGSVISSCGIIMAATLGSLWAGGLALLQEVGFALALGILIDTYFVRPILIPSFFLALRGRRPGRQTAVSESVPALDP